MVGPFVGFVVFAGAVATYAVIDNWRKPIVEKMSCPVCAPARSDVHYHITVNIQDEKELIPSDYFFGDVKDRRGRCITYRCMDDVPYLTCSGDPRKDDVSFPFFGETVFIEEGRERQRNTTVSTN